MPTPLVLGLGVPELLIILAVVLLLFGGSRLAGLGKSTGRALKEFKEETKGLKADDGSAPNVGPNPAPPTTAYPPAGYQNPAAPTAGTDPNASPQQYQQPPAGNSDVPGADPRKNV